MKMWRWLAILFFGLNLILLYQLFGGSLGLGRYNDLKSSKNHLQAELAVTEQANQRLSREILLLKNDNSVLEKAIRSEMHYLRPGEVMYLFSKE